MIDSGKKSLEREKTKMVEDAKKKLFLWLLKPQKKCWVHKS